MGTVAKLIAVIVVVIIILIAYWYYRKVSNYNRLISELRKLWLNEVVWIKSYINVLVTNSGDNDKNAVLARLTKNHMQIAKLISKDDKTKFNNIFNMLNKFLGEYGSMANDILNNDWKKAKLRWKNVYAINDSLGKYITADGRAAVIRKNMQIFMQDINQMLATRFKRKFDNNNVATDNALNHAVNIADTIAITIA